MTGGRGGSRMDAMRISAVIFDLDGTLTRPVLDFGRIRAEIGVPEGALLDGIEAMSESARAAAFAVLHRYEDEAAGTSELHPGTEAVLARLREQRRRLGLATSNRRVSVETVCSRHGLSFDAIVTREDGPVKPDAFPVLAVCERLGVTPGEVVYVGDYLFDMQCARAAGARAVLMASHQEWRTFCGEADHVIHEPGELLELIAQWENGDVAERRADAANE